jgi:hypothetical protein
VSKKQLILAFSLVGLALFLASLLAPVSQPAPKPTPTPTTVLNRLPTPLVVQGEAIGVFITANKNEYSVGEVANLQVMFENPLTHPVTINYSVTVDGQAVDNGTEVRELGRNTQFYRTFQITTTHTITFQVSIQTQDKTIQVLPKPLIPATIRVK